MSGLSSLIKCWIKTTKIVIENNAVIEKEEIKKKLSFLYEENLFLINTEDITKRLENETFISGGKRFKIKAI